MADDTTDTTPGNAPDVLKTGSDGSLPDLRGRQAWVWMQDTPEGGGGRFDVRADRVDVWRRKGAQVVPDYPIHIGRSGRTAKPSASLAGGRTGDAEPIEDQRPGDPTGEPVEDQRLGDPPGEPDQAAGEPAAADTTTTRPKGGRTR